MTLGWEHNWIKSMDASAILLNRRRIFKTKAQIFAKWHDDVIHVKGVRDTARKLVHTFEFLLPDFSPFPLFRM